MSSALLFRMCFLRALDQAQVQACPNCQSFCLMNRMSHFKGVARNVLFWSTGQKGNGILVSENQPGVHLPKQYLSVVRKSIRMKPWIHIKKCSGIQSRAIEESYSAVPWRKNDQKWSNQKIIGSVLAKFKSENWKCTMETGRLATLVRGFGTRLHLSSLCSCWQSFILLTFPQPAPPQCRHQ